MKGFKFKCAMIYEYQALSSCIDHVMNTTKKKAFCYWLMPHLGIMGLNIRGLIFEEAFYSKSKEHHEVPSILWGKTKEAFPKGVY
jgi:hypothetical protein